MGACGSLLLESGLASGVSWQVSPLLAQNGYRLVHCSGFLDHVLISLVMPFELMNVGFWQASLTLQPCVGISGKKTGARAIVPSLLPKEH
jgi:hypothetical protein